MYEHAQCGVFERTCLQRAYVIPCRQQMGMPQRVGACSEHAVLAGGA